jgi:hypothetical protein
LGNYFGSDLILEDILAMKIKYVVGIFRGLRCGRGSLLCEHKFKHWKNKFKMYEVVQPRPGQTTFLLIKTFQEVQPSHDRTETGLPDGIFSNQKSQIGQIFRGFQWKRLAVFGHLVYFTDIWYNLQPFGIFVGYSVDFPPFG